MSFTCQSTLTFDSSLSALQKKPKEGYALCNEEICNAFKGLTFDDVYNMSLCLREMGDARILKIRLPNRHQGLSAADGFRIIVLCSKKNQTITLLNIYPKRGKQGKLGQAQADTITQVHEYAAQHKAGTLTKRDIENELVPIP